MREQGILLKVLYSSLKMLNGNVMGVSEQCEDGVVKTEDAFVSIVGSTSNLDGQKQHNNVRTDGEYFRRLPVFRDQNDDFFIIYLDFLKPV